MLDNIVVISLERTPERYESFRRLNPGVRAEKVSGVDGRLLDRDRLIAEGLIRPGNAYKPGALGNAASHIGMWRRCAAEDRAIHILEDDAILRPDFASVAASILAGLADWDIVLWGWNFDWPMKLRLAPGLGSAVLQASQPELHAQWPSFRAGPAPVLAELVSAAGILCYSLAPRGARRLIDRCLPLGGRPAVFVAKPTLGWINLTIDVELSRHYGGLAAFVALPPIAVSLNDPRSSLTQGGRSGAAGKS